MNASPDFSSSELARYERQIRIDRFGLGGQRRLKAATVMISRVGGVGGTVAMHLARAGIGHLVLAHGGQIVPEYLNRMPLAVPEDVGRPCTEVFVEKLHAINPDVRLTACPSNINAQNVADLVRQVDLVVDGAPLFEERYLMNQEAVSQCKPLVMAAMYNTEGYVTTIVPGETPCLACIYPTKPDYWTNIKVFPAIGPGPALVGAVAAMDAIKVLTGFGQSLKGTLWFFDLETTDVRRFQIHRRTDCPVCSSLPAQN
jgi:molybdopterin/thiamine biosynthesis adenylyltransferase